MRAALPGHGESVISKSMRGRHASHHVGDERYGEAEGIESRSLCAGLCVHCFCFLPFFLDLYPFVKGSSRSRQAAS